MSKHSWSPEQRRKFHATWAARAEAKAWKAKARKAKQKERSEVLPIINIGNGHDEEFARFIAIAWRAWKEQQ